MKQINQWLYFEPYVAISSTESEVLLYNTLNGDHLLSTNRFILHIVSSMLEAENGGVAFIESALFNNEEVADFLRACRERFFGDFIDVDLSDKKPVQIYPIANLQTEISKLEKDSERSLADDSIAYLEQIDFYVNSSCSSNCSYCSFAYKQISICSKSEKPTELPVETIFSIVNSDMNLLKKITISGGNIFAYSKFEELVQLIKQRDLYSEWNIHYKNLDMDKIGLLKKSNMIVNVFVDSMMETDAIRRLWGRLSEINLSLKIIIRSESDYLEFENSLLPMLGGLNYEIRLLYDYTNYDFIREYTFMSMEDILDEKQSMREIFANQKMNRLYFGYFTIFPNGDVYANLNKPTVGNIKVDSLGQLVYAEMVKGQSWLQVRNMEPCANCVFRWLCPPPSNYEAVLDKFNLCDLR